jgi:23S rRNA (adenine2503-C2)-methyltransferase
MEGGSMSGELKIIRKDQSLRDDVVKYIFETEEGKNEVSLIRKEGKNVICLPTQTNCNLGCKFCHLTGTHRDVVNISSETLIAYVEYFLREYCLILEDKQVLVSFMGAGEPLHNIDNMVAAMDDLYSKYGDNKYGIRFGVASTIPSEKSMYKFLDLMEEKDYLCKLHMSLHGIDTRADMMYDTFKARDAIKLVKLYISETFNDAEFHYALIDDLNDTDDEVNALEEALYEGAHIKFIVLNPVDKLKPSAHLEEIVDYLRDSKKNFTVEVYTPPGRDIGSSCGQFHREIYE